MPSAPSSASPAPGRRTWLVALGVGLVTAAAYAPTLGSGFVNWDDDIYVTDNPVIRSGGPGLLRYAFLEFHASNWHPLTWLSHAADVEIWGLDPRGHHLTSILLHAASAALVVVLGWYLLRRALSGRVAVPEREARLGAALAGLLFGLHPVHVESAAWIAERKDVLAAVFYLGALALWAAGLESPAGDTQVPRCRKGALLGSLGLFALALLAKPMAVSLPLVMLVLGWYPYGRFRDPAARAVAIREALPFAGLAGLAAVLNLAAQRAGESVVAVEQVGVGTRLLVAARAVAAYLGKLVLPIELLPFYPHPRSASLLEPGYLLPVLLVIALTVAAVLLARRGPWWLSSWACFLVMLAPVLGIVQAGGQAMADRYLYLPSLPPFLLVGAGVAVAWGSARAAGRRVVVVAGVAVLAVFLALTVRQQAVWRSSIDLWTHAIDHEASRAPLAYYNRGQAWVAEGALDRAIADYTVALTLNPRYREAFFNRGVMRERAGDLPAAIADYREVLRLAPSDPSALNNLGVALARSEAYPEAWSVLSRLLELAPSRADAWLNRGLVAARLGRTDQAESDVRRACELGLPQACGMLGAPAPGGGR